MTYESYLAEKTKALSRKEALELCIKITETKGRLMLSSKSSEDYFNPDEVNETLLKGCYEKIETLERQLEKAFQVLESLGVSRTRAKTVANGIMVLDQRYSKEINCFQAILGRR